MRTWGESSMRKGPVVGWSRGAKEVGPAGLKGKGTGGPGLRYSQEPEMGPRVHGRSLSLTHRKPLKVRFAFWKHHTSCYEKDGSEEVPVGLKLTF